MSEPDAVLKSNNIVLMIAIGIVFIFVIGFIFYRLRTKWKQMKPNTTIKENKAENKPQETLQEDPFKNCKTFATSHGLRIFKCNELGDPIEKVSFGNE